jgi:hypothetical protein
MKCSVLILKKKNSNIIESFDEIKLHFKELHPKYNIFVIIG